MSMTTELRVSDGSSPDSVRREAPSTARRTNADAVASAAMPAASTLAAFAAQQVDYRSATVRMLEDAFKDFPPPVPPLTLAVQPMPRDWMTPALASIPKTTPGALALVSAAAAAVSPGATALAHFASLESLPAFKAMSQQHATSVAVLVSTVQTALGKANLLGSLNSAALFSRSSVGSMLASYDKAWATAGLSGLTAAMSAAQTARMTVLRSNFEQRAGSPSGALGRLDAAIHLDTTLGQAVDGLIASPTRSAALGFDYRSVHHRVRQVDDLLRENDVPVEIVEAVEEAQDAAGLNEDLMFDFSQSLGIPASRSGRGPSAASILIVATVGTSLIVLDASTGHALAPSGVIATLLLGKELWGWLRGDRKPE